MSKFKLLIQGLVVVVLLVNVVLLGRIALQAKAKSGGGLKEFLVSILPAWKKYAAPVEKKQKYEITAIIDSSCKECSGLDEIVGFIKASVGVEVTKDETIDYATTKEAAQALIDKHKITELPSLIIKGPRPDDPNFLQFWDQFGVVEGDTFILTKVQPPYRNLADGSIGGLFKITYLADKSCAKCYDVSLHRNAFQRLSMNVTSEEKLDISDARGRELVKKYAIKLVPTILVEGDLGAYDGFQSVWPSVGTKETDGVYIFRDGVAQMGPYKDLKTGKLVEPEPYQPDVTVPQP